MEIRSVFYLAHERNFTDPINSKCQDIALPPPFTIQSKLCDKRSGRDAITHRRNNVMR